MITLSKKTAALVALCLVIAGSVPAGIVGAYLGAKVTSNHDAIKAVVKGIRRVCDDDHKFRVQYKLRGKAEQELLSLFVNLAKQQVKAAPEGGARRSQSFLEEFAPLVKRLKVIPVTDCQKQAKELRAYL